MFSLKSLTSWLLTAVIVLAIQQWSQRNMVSGVMAPDLVGVQVDGHKFEGLESLKKPALIYFWGSWCGVCRLMQGTLRSLEESGVPLVSVALASGDRTTVAEYQNAHDFKVKTVIDSDGRLGNAYGVVGVPALFFIDPEGRVASVSRGYTTLWSIRLRLWLAGL